MRQLLLIYCYCCSIINLFAQEICDNGIDDDNDGWVDFNDEDCRCFLGETFSIVPNPSFEQLDCCPENISELFCAEAWMQGSDGTTDLFHDCDTIVNDQIPIPPRPFPDGQGVSGFFNSSFIVAGPNRPTPYKEYASTCLLTPLERDTTYVLDFFLGFGLLEEGKAKSFSPVEVVLFGTRRCSNLPFSGVNCPLESNLNNWFELARVEVVGKENWVRKRLTFVAPADIEAIVIGPNCRLISEERTSHYYFIDRVLMLKESKKRFLGDIEIAAGLPCFKNVVLEVANLSNTNYQWYFNKIAIPNATQSTFSIPSGLEAEGDYQVRIQNDEHCVFSLPFSYKIEGFPRADLGMDTILCDNMPLILGADNVGDSFIWSTGETTPNISIDGPGAYAVTVSNECGEATDEIMVLEEETQTDCIFKVPNVFTPNQDGLNDEFGPLTECCMQSYEFTIYNRWGRLIFQSNEVHQKWDGTFEGGLAPSDVYIWQITRTYIITGEEKTTTEAGDITLIR